MSSRVAEVVHLLDVGRHGFRLGPLALLSAKHPLAYYKTSVERYTSAVQGTAIALIRCDTVPDADTYIRDNTVCTHVPL